MDISTSRQLPKSRSDWETIGPCQRLYVGKWSNLRHPCSCRLPGTWARGTHHTTPAAHLESSPFACVVRLPSAEAGCSSRSVRPIADLKASARRQLTLLAHTQECTYGSPARCSRACPDLSKLHMAMRLVWVEWWSSAGLARLSLALFPRIFTSQWRHMKPRRRCGVVHAW